MRGGKEVRLVMNVGTKRGTAITWDFEDADRRARRKRIGGTGPEGRKKSILTTWGARRGRKESSPNSEH